MDPYTAMQGRQYLQDKALAGFEAGMKYIMSGPIQRGAQFAKRNLHVPKIVRNLAVYHRPTIPYEADPERMQPHFDEYLPGTELWKLRRSERSRADAQRARKGMVFNYFTRVPYEGVRGIVTADPFAVEITEVYGSGERLRTNLESMVAELTRETPDQVEKPSPVMELPREFAEELSLERVS